MAFKPSTNYDVGDVFTTTYDRTYIILGGPWADNVGVWYVVMDKDDGLVGFQTERRLEGLARTPVAKPGGKK